MFTEVDTWKVLEKEEGSLGRKRGDVLGRQIELDGVIQSEENGLIPQVDCRFES